MNVGEDNGNTSRGHQRTSSSSTSFTSGEEHGTNHCNGAARSSSTSTTTTSFVNESKRTTTTTTISRANQNQCGRPSPERMQRFPLHCASTAGRPTPERRPSTVPQQPPTRNNDVDRPPGHMQMACFVTDRKKTRRQGKE